MEEKYIHYQDKRKESTKTDLVWLKYEDKQDLVKELRETGLMVEELAGEIKILTHVPADKFDHYYSYGPLFNVEKKILKDEQ